MDLGFFQILHARQQLYCDLTKFNYCLYAPCHSEKYPRGKYKIFIRIKTKNPEDYEDTESWQLRRSQ
jgi:hypothetical protein